MRWKLYEVVFRLKTPLHSGWKKVGNLQMTRPYVTGRMLWGALTMRITRMVAGDNPAVSSTEYERIGNEVHKTLAFTYFYPALKHADKFKVYLPWKKASEFRRRFLGSYQSTALNYPFKSAEDEALHEVEFLSPTTFDDGQPVFLKGYIFEREGCNLPWQEALEKLQLGGERGYGWGKVELNEKPRELMDSAEIVFGTQTFKVDLGKERPVIKPLLGDRCLLSHVDTKGLESDIQGEVEPLIGREWKNKPGEKVSDAKICFMPGSKAKRALDFEIAEYGLWKLCKG